MPVIRLLLLLVVLGGLTLLLAQNWSPVLPLVFLGMTTQALPLAVWILLSVAAGAFTSLLIAGLFSLSKYSVRASSPRSKAAVGAQRSEAPRTTSPSQPDTDSTSSADDDWDTDSTADDDWDFGEVEKTPNTSQPVKDSKSHEVSNEPKTSYQSGAYSYSYQEPSNSGVGKTESVYDADYRVIKPPYQQTNTAQDDDDWGFEDDFEAEGESDSPNVRR